MTSGSIDRSDDRSDDFPPRALRAKLLDLAGEFVARARVLEGVSRIALLGSIVTAKENPKDIDLLVTVTDECDLAQLAALGRRLQGRAQGFNHGADVFLASLSGRYLGRTCHWRECRPGIRASCDAVNCGARPHLHDDLGSVTISGALIHEPPLEVHPGIVIRQAVPADITAWLATLGPPTT